MHVSLFLEMAADADPGRVVVGSRADGITAGALRERAGAAATALRAHGAERVAYVGENGPALPIALFASALAELPFAPLNYRLDDHRLEELLGRLAPAVAIVDAGVARRVAPPGVELLERDAFLAASAAAPGTGAAPPVTAGPDAIAALLFTSGTTSEPKAAVLRHRHLAAYVISTVEFMSAGEDEATLIGVPPYHIASISAVLTSVYAGRRLVYLSAFEAERWVATARAEAITHAMVVPTMLGRILDVLARDGAGLPALRHLSYGGGPMPPAVVERALEMLPAVGLVNAYGLTETSSTIALLGPEDHREAFASADPVVRRRLGSVGRPLPELEVAIADPDGERLGPGEWGEIVVRGEQVSGEYDGRSSSGAEGWFATHDRGMLDDAGYLYVGGRLDDVIVRGGENLSPGEIEDALCAHAAVVEAAVVAAPSEEWGEEPVAFVVVREPVEEDELRGWVRERLRSAKTPTAVVVREALPYSETGKLLRRELRADAERLRAAR